LFLFFFLAAHERGQFVKNDFMINSATRFILSVAALAVPALCQSANEDEIILLCVTSRVDSVGPWFSWAERVFLETLLRQI
jgi:hypothetical protein